MELWSSALCNSTRERWMTPSHPEDDSSPLHSSAWQSVRQIRGKGAHQGLVWSGEEGDSDFRSSACFCNSLDCVFQILLVSLCLWEVQRGVALARRQVVNILFFYFIQNGPMKIKHFWPTRSPILSYGSTSGQIVTKTCQNLGSKNSPKLLTSTDTGLFCLDEFLITLSIMMTL